MILYGYNERGAYVGPVAAGLSPARPFINDQPNYLRPANTTELAPPEAQAGQVALFDGQAWKLVDDLRGRTAYQTQTGLPVLLTELGPLPQDMTLLVPASACCVWDGTAWQVDPQRQLVELRQQRNARLAGCDWTQLADNALSEESKQAWRTYRQALRDLTCDWTPETPWPSPPQE